MDTKLTLKLDQGVIVKAKQYASARKTSLSKLIENYLQTITIQPKSDDIEISPFVKSMSSKVNMGNDINYKDIYSDYLMEKYR